MKIIQNNPIWFIVLIETALSNLGLFSVLALLPLYFLNYLALSNGEASFLLFFSALSLKLARLIFYPFFYRLSARQVLMISFSLCSSGYILMGLTFSPWIIGISLYLIGMGYGASSILVKVIITTLSHSSNHQQNFLNFSKLGAVINFGAAIGPLIGNVIFIHYKQCYICFFAATIFALATSIAFLFPSNFTLQETKISPIEAIIVQLKLKNMRGLILLTISGGFLYAQFFTSLSIFVGKGLTHPDKIGLLFFINAIIVTVGSISLSQLAMTFFKAEVKIICFSFGLFFTGFIVLLFFQTLVGAYVAMVIWTIAEIFLLSSLNTLAAFYCPPEYKTIGFIINALALGVGESLGNLVGMNLSSFGLQGNWSITFISMSSIAFLLMILSYLSTNRLRVDSFNSHQLKPS